MRSLISYCTSVGFVTIATLLGMLAVRVVHYASLTLIYLLAVLIAAQRYGLRQAIFTSVLSILAWDYFFTVPYFSFVIEKQSDVFALIVFLSVALLVSATTARIQAQNKQLATLARSKTQLYAFSQELAAVKKPEELVELATRSISTIFRRAAKLALDQGWDPGQGGAGACSRDPLANTGFEAGISLPLQGFRGTIGTVYLGGDIPATRDELQLLRALADHVATALERIWLSAEREHSQIAAETQRIRNSMLISVSHDLRTPLTTIIGSLSTLEVLGPHAQPHIRKELGAIALTEAQRLDRFIGNLLDMTKLELGALDANLIPVSVGDAVDAALARVSPLLRGHSIALSCPEEPIMAKANPSLLEQALFNILDNAAKYSPDNSEIAVLISERDATVFVRIADEGDGIPASFEGSIFQKFARAAQGDSKLPGTGLGLVIAQGFMEAMGGQVVAANRSDRRGAIFTLQMRVAPAALDKSAGRGGAETRSEAMRRAGQFQEKRI
jgi:two-component system sensor histidine kinase KdpD